MIFSEIRTGYHMAIHLAVHLSAWVYNSWHAYLLAYTHTTGILEEPGLNIMNRAPANTNVLSRAS